MLKNFGPRPRTCELAIDNGGNAVFHQTLVLAPREQITVPFGPLTTGGLVHAQILSRDALDADNDRYAYAVVDSPAHVLVLSPDAAVRDDIARVLLAVNSNFIIATADPTKFKADQQYSLAVMHDCYIAGVQGAIDPVDFSSGEQQRQSAGAADRRHNCGSAHDQSGPRRFKCGADRFGVHSHGGRSRMDDGESVRHGRRCA